MVQRLEHQGTVEMQCGRRNGLRACAHKVQSICDGLQVLGHLHRVHFECGDVRLRMTRQPFTRQARAAAAQLDKLARLQRQQGVHQVQFVAP